MLVVILVFIAFVSFFAVFGGGVCQDKTEEEMEKFVSPFSLTSLCVAADMSAEDIIAQVGKPFKRCLVRLTVIVLIGSVEGANLSDNTIFFVIVSVADLRNLIHNEIGFS